LDWGRAGSPYCGVTTGQSVTVDGFIAAFAGRLRDRAQQLELYGASEAAGACAAVADDLEHEFQTWWSEELSIAAASRESGYSADRLRAQVRAGKLPARREGSPGGEICIRRADLPRRVRMNEPQGIDDLAREVLTERK
jgi:hypothetical protein